MIELQLIAAWLNARIAKIRAEDEAGRQAGFSTLEWVALAGVIIIAAIAVATVLMNKAKTGAGRINVQ